MFGTVQPNTKLLSAAAKKAYQSYYCGLCHQLGAKYGALGRLALSFDMTFLCLLHSAVYAQAPTQSAKRCVRHPFAACPTAQTAATEYAADLTILLAYYKCIDDWQDDHNFLAKQQAQRLAVFLPQLQKSYPRQCAAIQQNLARLSQLEKRNDQNPDHAANCFGALLGDIFVAQPQHPSAQQLFRMGAALGRFIYLMDAANDLRSDLKKQRYNPFCQQTNCNFLPLLTFVLAECTAAFDALCVTQHTEILQNILYSGVWLSYRRKEATHERPV